MDEPRAHTGSDAARGRFVQVVGWLLAPAGVGLVGALASRGEIAAGTAWVVGCLSVVSSIVMSAGFELRARDRLRVAWLDRLHQLTDELARAAEADDPAQLVRDAADRASAGITAPRAMSDERIAFLRSVADQCAQAHERLELHRAQVRARSDLELLARASPRLAESLDVERVTRTLQALIVPELADTCELRVHPEGAKSARGSGGDAPSAEVIPLHALGESVGDLVIARHEGPVAIEDLATARLLAEPAARALHHALRFTVEAHASSTLQDSLLPRAVLEIPNLEVSTRYLAATAGQAVGGDFYDVIRCPNGTATLVVGDVQGKGIEAAALTSTARHTLRTSALDGESPGDMLRRVNDALLYAEAERSAATGQPSVRFVTLAVVSLTPSPTGFSAVVASGGHPPPIVIRPSGEIERVVPDGPLVGVFADASYKERHLDLRLSDLLVMFTDGVTERRRQPELFDEAQLGRLVRNQLTARSADAVAQLILDTVVDLSPREVRDDIALVVARVTGPRHA